MERISTLFRLPVVTRIQIDELRELLELRKKTNTEVIIYAIESLYNKIKEEDLIE